MNGKRGRKSEEGKREPTGLGKDFDFQMPAIYVMVELTIQVVRTTRKTYGKVNSAFKKLTFFQQGLKIYCFKSIIPLFLSLFCSEY